MGQSKNSLYRDGQDIVSFRILSCATIRSLVWISPASHEQTKVLTFSGTERHLDSSLLVVVVA